MRFIIRSIFPRAALAGTERGTQFTWKAALLLAVLLYSFVTLPLTINDLFHYTLYSWPQRIVTLIVLLAAYIFLFRILFSFSRLWYNLFYNHRAWYRNTGIKPREVLEDLGLYGEYCATMACEANLRRHRMYGRILNNVVIPKKDGDFNEIDVVMVCEAGIFVIEAKAWNGELIGNATAPTLQQKLGNTINEVKNPLVQNITHCNYLQEYLYEKLTDETYEKVFEHLYNTVILTLGMKTDKMNFVPHPDGYMMMHPVRFKTKNLKKFTGGVHLSREDVDCIADVLEPVAHYSREQYEDMLQQRAVMQNQGAYSHPVKYYNAHGTRQLTPRSIEWEWDTVCRDNGYYRTYRNNIDGMFYADPAFRIKEHGSAYSSLEKLLQDNIRRDYEQNASQNAE